MSKFFSSAGPPSYPTPCLEVQSHHPLAIKRFQPQHYGPFTITNVISNVVYQLALPSHWKIHNIFHALLLTPYYEAPIHGPNHLEPPPDIIDREPEWEVKRIMETRTFRQKREKQYHVRRKGYSEAHDSWEPTTNIHTPELVVEFNERQQRDKSRAQFVRILSEPVTDAGLDSEQT